jgi:hypothetical protein
MLPCAALAEFVGDEGMRAAIKQQGGIELARAALARFPESICVKHFAPQVIEHA